MPLCITDGNCVVSALMLHCVIRTGNYVLAKHHVWQPYSISLLDFADTIQWSVLRQTAMSSCEGLPTFKGQSQSLKHW